MSNSLQPHESQHARPPCPSATPGVHSDSRPSSQWCRPAISSSVIPFSCPQSLPASESFSMSQLFSWGGQSTGVAALASFLPKKSQSLVNSLKSFLNIPNTPQILWYRPLSDPKLFHYMSQEEEILLLIVSQEGWHFWVDWFSPSCEDSWDF